MIKIILILLLWQTNAIANDFNALCDKASKIHNDKQQEQFEATGVSLRQINDLCERRK